jgi:CDP-diacylglycerol--glycerol-3-phosphate 3-phosphatidyltransferase/cardiolipin synthase
MKERVFSLPNILSIIRLPLAILFVVYSHSWLRYLFLLLAVLSDMFDGYAARKLNQMTKLGAILDPIFDKIFVLIVFISLFLSQSFPLYILLFFLRDMFTLIGALALILFRATSLIEIKARGTGKVVTCLQLLVLFFMIQGSSFWFQFSFIILVLSSIVSVVEYAVLLLQQLRRVV